MLWHAQDERGGQSVQISIKAGGPFCIPCFNDVFSQVFDECLETWIVLVLRQ